MTGIDLTAVVVVALAVFGCVRAICDVNAEMNANDNQTSLDREEIYRKPRL